MVDVSLGNRLQSAFERMWPLVFAEGILAVVIGIMLVTTPVRTVLFLLQVLGIYWLLSGIVRVISSLFKKETYSGWGWRLAGGAIFMLLGAAILAYPLYAAAVTSIALVYTLATMAIIGGVLNMAWGISTIGHVPGEWLTLVGGMLSILFGIMLYAAPFFAVTALLVFVGIFAVLGGIGEIALSVRMRSFGRIVRKQVEKREYATR